MSGHAGFQPIGSNLPPPVLQPGSANAPEGAVPVGTGATQPPPEGPAAAPGLPPESPKTGAKPLAGKLDAMLLKAAEMSTKAVASTKLSKAVEGVGLSIGELSDLTDLADAAAESFAKLGEFSGRQIAAALVAGENGAFDWKEDDSVASAIRKALDDQAALAEKLHDLANDRRVSGPAFEAICDQAFIADRRQSEILTLAVQIADAAERAGDDFVRQAFKVSDAYVPAYRENLDGIRGACPHLARAADLRHRIHDQAKLYVEDRAPRRLQEMYKLANKLSFANGQKVAEEIRMLRRAAGGQFDMTDAEWSAFEAEFSHVQGAASQIAHLDAMLGKVDSDNGMKSADFLTTDSARLLLEGKLSFPSLVEARIHGVADADVDPALDDLRLAGSRPLGQGAANTVFLVTYEDGKEYVFKPEAPGRQGMASLTLSKDYKPHQLISHLNIATQKTADALGLGDIMPRTTAGAHKGRFGLFMEKAPGTGAASFADGKGKLEPGHLTAAQVRRLSDADHAKVVGEIVRKTNRTSALATFPTPRHAVQGHPPLAPTAPHRRGEAAVRHGAVSKLAISCLNG